MRLSRRWLVIAAGALVAAALFWPRPDAQGVRRVLDTGVAALGAKPDEDAARRAQRLDQELGPLVADAVRVDVAGAFSGEGRERALAAATELGRGRHPALELRQVEVVVHGSSRASARFDVVASDSQAGDLHAVPRHARAELEKQSGRWQVTALTVEAEARAEPEPRP